MQLYCICKTLVVVIIISLIFFVHIVRHHVFVIKMLSKMLCVHFEYDFYKCCYIGVIKYIMCKITTFNCILSILFGIQHEVLNATH